MTAIPTQLALPSDLLTGVEWNGAQIAEMFRLTADMKQRPSSYSAAMSGRFIALIMEKPSLRTSATFQVGMQSMGGSAILLDHTVSRLGERESVPDMARNLSRWVQGIVARVFEQQKLEQLAEYASIPVINALSDRFHPCQAYADFFTLQEHFGGGNLRGLKLAYVGDGNNVCHSLMTVGALLGARVRVGTPKGYAPSADILAEARGIAAVCGGAVELFNSAEEAVAGAQAVYTDVWASMGQENEGRAREKIFAPYQVNMRLLESAAPGAVFMHCLPAHRGAEVTDAVMDSARSIVFDQAENRLHVQKAVLLMLIH
jgi:ornithine carbamoyltransferase